jgi:Circadian oscillating protein COP23
MPIDPKKFKKIVTNHFDNLTEEEFLKTLHQSSPHLFDESLGEKREAQLSGKAEIASAKIIENDTSHATPVKYIHKQKILVKNKKTWNILIMLGTLVAPLFVGLVVGNILNNTWDNSSIATPVFTSKQRFQCEVKNESVILAFKVANLKRPLIRFIDTKLENSEYPKMNRCQMVINNIRRYTDRSNVIGIRTGVINGRSIICVSEKPGAGCIKDKYNGEIISLGSSSEEDREEKFDLFMSAFSTNASGRILIDQY